jgi:hypothetical protein
MKIELSRSLTFLIGGTILGIFGLASPGFWGQVMVAWGAVFIIVGVFVGAWDYAAEEVMDVEVPAADRVEAPQVNPALA